jgi:hypothetical protein
MKQTKNTYSLLVASEEKGRGIFEGTIYGLVILCTAFSAWQFASKPVTTPGMGGNKPAPAAVVAETSPKPVVLADRG